MKTTSLFRTLSALALIAALGTVPLLSGCGGSNAGSSNSPLRSADDNKDTPKNAGKALAENLGGKMGLFVTATPGNKSAFGHAWATIQKVEVLDIQDKWVTVFESLDGATIDLTELNGADGQRFQLLACANVPAGRSYNRVRVTFAKAFQVFEPGSNIGKTQLLAEAMGHDEQERPILSFALDRPRDLGGGHQDVTMEFDLSKFETKDNMLLPFVKDGMTTAPELSRQVPARIVGTVSEVAAKDDGTTFTLTLDGGQKLTAQATDTTVFYNDGPVPNPKLDNGKQVALTGVLSPDTQNLLATQVKVYGETKPSGDIVTVRGVLSGVNPKAGTMAVTATQVQGMTPTMNAITVTVTPDAVLRSSGGVLLKPEEFYGMLGAGRNALATFEGTYEPVTGAMKATRIKLEESLPGGGHEAAAHGTPKDIQADAGTFTLDSLAEWDGIASRAEGKGVSVATTAATAFRDDKGQYLASTSFFTGAASGEKSVRVTGIYAGGVLTATRMDLLPPTPKPEVKDGAAANLFTVGPSPEEQKAASEKAPEKDAKAAKPDGEQKTPEKTTQPAKPEPTKTPDKPSGI